MNNRNRIIIFLIAWLMPLAMMAQTNHWTPQTSGFENNMPLTCVIQINGVEQQSTALEVGAFCGTECRGSALPMLFPGTGRYVVFLTIFGVSGDQFTFKLYDHNQGMELNLQSPNAVTFNPDGLGWVGDPYELNFTAEYYTISASANPTAGGTVSGAGNYQSGATCTLTATANTGYTFTNWTKNGLVVSTSASYSFTVTGNGTYVANFSQNTYTISASANPSAGGSVTGAGNYNYGATCNLTATANMGYTFTNWTKNGLVVSTNASYSFTVTSSGTYVANFSQNTYTISATANPSAGGSVTGAGNYIYGATCTLTATASTGYTFTNWTKNGTVVSTNANYSFTVTSGGTYVANFSQNSYTISASANPSAGGSVSGGGTYNHGSTCTLTATANTGYTFTNWTKNGTVVSTSANYSFTVTGNGTYVANFEAENIIVFADPNVKAICVANWDTNGSGELSYAEAAAVTSLGQVFMGDTTITSFEELQYFTGLTSISSSAFKNCSNLSGTLYIPNSVTSIGDHAFYQCSGLSGNLNIPNSVTMIDACAFESCIGFTGDLTIPNSVISIGVNAFANCNGFSGSLTLSNSMTSTGVQTFMNCSGFTGGLTIPNSVTLIGNRAFYGCSGLTGDLTIPNAVTSIGHNAFYGCSSFTGNLTIGNSVTSIGSCAFESCSGFTGNLIIPNAVTTIDDYAFSYCSGFTGSLTIGNSVTSIGRGAFEFCSGFTGSLTIPNTVTSIGIGAFEGCSGFTGSLTIPSSVTTISWAAFSGCSGFTGSLTIPNSVTIIERAAFHGCSGFGSLSIPDSVIEIGEIAFRGCSGFTGDLIIPNSVTSIGGCAFQNCNSFTGSLTIPNSVTTIGNHAFTDCNGFTGSLTIGNSVTTIGDAAFFRCTGFTSMNVLPEAPPTLGSSVFYNVTKTIPVYVPCSSVSSYQAAEGWNEFTNYQCINHEYVDLGLPSGTLWATYNVGAYSPEEYGDYFAWGETQTKDNYDWSTYQYCMGSIYTLTKYCNNSSYGYSGFTDDLITLLPEDDAATANWGSDWRMPTKAEFQELFANTTVTWTQQNGVNGRLFTASNGNSLFLPAAGHRYDSSLDGAGSCGYYWSSSLNSDYPYLAWLLSFGSDNLGMSSSGRYIGRSVRAVRNIFHVTVSSNPAEGGTIEGGGTYEEGATCTLTATANAGYTFVNWTENDEVVSTEATYSFTVTGNRDLVANFTQQSPFIPTEDLVAYYPFDGDANDYSGNGNHGTIIGNVVPATDRHGNPNGAFRFPGEAFNYISVPDAEVLHLNAFTLSAWVYTDADDYGSGYLINKGRDINNGSYRLYVSGVGSTTQYGGSNDASIEYEPEVGKWHMVTGTVEGDQARYYLDGILQAEVTLSHPFSYNNTQPLTFGCHYYNGVPSYWAYTLLGVMDEVRIYSRVLTAQEVMSLYNYENLIAYYPFNGDANDYSGNGYHATPCNNYQYEGGVMGECISVEGQGYMTSAGGHVLLPQYDFGAASGITLSLWVKALGLTSSDGETYINFGDHTNADGVYILQNPNTVQFTYHGSSISIPYQESYTGNWIMYTLTCGSDGKLRGYVNGTLVGQEDVDYNGQINTSLAALGRHWWYSGSATSTRFIGSFDEVRIYNRVLSAQEVIQLYNKDNGCLPGVFSVSASTQVNFSQGNLQWSATGGGTDATSHAVADGGTATGTWRFAEHQYDYIGSDNNNVSSTYNGWIDVFGYGTSGWNSGATYYQPYNTEWSAYGYTSGNLIGDMAYADWGEYNAISNGGNIPSQWRTLSQAEFRYMLNTRQASTVNGTENARYAKASVNGTNGLILLPDNYTHPSGTPALNNINVSTAVFEDNSYTIEQWNLMEKAGAVFLPAAGWRNQEGYSDGNVMGRYRTTTEYGSMRSYTMQFHNDYVSVEEGWYNNAWGDKRDGHSVRLVRTIQHRFITPGTWSTASNWLGGALPGANDEVFIDALCQLDQSVTVAALTVSNGQSLTLQSGKTLSVTGNLTNTVAAGLVIEDGAQLVHNVANVQATVRKVISPFSGLGDGWHLIALPLTGSSNVASVDNLLENQYDLYAYDEATTYWRNQKNTESGFTVLQATKGYLYANGEEVTLGFSGTLENSSATITVPLSFTDGAHLSGFNLVGNPFPCNAYLNREYYVLTTDGTDINPEPIQATTPIPPCTAVFVKAVAEGETVVFTLAP